MMVFLPSRVLYINDVRNISHLRHPPIHEHGNPAQNAANTSHVDASSRHAASVALVQNDADTTSCYLITYHCTSLFTCEPVWMLILRYSPIHDATRPRGFNCEDPF